MNIFYVGGVQAMVQLVPFSRQPESHRNKRRGNTFASLGDKGAGSNPDTNANSPHWAKRIIT